MTLRTLITLSATIVASTAFLSYTGMAQNIVKVSTASQIQNTSYQPISDASIESAIENSILSGEHDAALNQNYGDGVAQAFREAYAMNVMNPLWTETSAEKLIESVSLLEDTGSIAPDLRLDAERAMKNRFDGRTAQDRAEGDMTLSKTYIRIENLRHAPEVNASEMAPPRLAGLDSHLLAAGQSGKTTHEEYELNFSSF